MYLLPALFSLIAISVASVSYLGLSGSLSSLEAGVATTATTVLYGSIDRSATTATTSKTALSGRITPVTARLSWMPPLARENGEPLLVGEITSYRIRIEKDGTLERNMRIDAQYTETSITLKARGTYGFSIAAIDDHGIASEYSPEVFKTVN